MKKLLSVLFVMCLLTGCASTGAVDSLAKRFDENNKRIDKNFVIVKNVLDAQAKAITELQPKKETPVLPTTPRDEVVKAVDEGKVVIKK